MTDQQPFPVLFLDIDGVLNNTLSRALLDGDCCRRLSRIIAATDCRIVLSSSWRHMLHAHADEPAMFSLRGFAYLLRTHGVRWAKVIGTTPLDADDLDRQVPRGAQCRQWLRANRVYPVGRFCAIDDDNDGFAEWQIPLVQTNPRWGLREEDVERVIEILKGETA